MSQHRHLKGFQRFRIESTTVTPLEQTRREKTCGYTRCGSTRIQVMRELRTWAEKAVQEKKEKERREPRVRVREKITLEK